ncbi:LamB/YcsF family protein [Knoellia subterranea]|uniref:5-oxoprolinase subunit A n=1 Tax=Knoellia subterranea KCTC 19937 TaxID=1385521 RepID=A0A0A0JLX9_9MICO|nr:5-oxoprolinase subunit PxpA [Knoellia subterranea]KGN37774.1 hypothetical protein N803_12000 [Knoellia subterranea KCTC 19937]
MTAVIDLNSDLGEGFGRWTLGDDEAMLGLVTSANVACGFHAGDPSILRRVCAQAAERGVAVGAQVGYRDLAGFGRRHIDVDSAELVDEVIYQLAALDGIARVEGTRVSYVKPHGALYNDAASSPVVAGAVAEATAAYAGSAPSEDASPFVLLGLAGSELLTAAEAVGLRPVAEAFADRAYTAEGLLVSRREPGAVLHDPATIAARCVRLATEGVVESIDGTTISVAAQSICVHGDTDGAVAIAREVRQALEGAGVEIRPFTGS